MKNLEEKIKEVQKIKNENRLVKNRIAALKAAGYEYAEANRKRLVREEVERELQEQFHIPVKIFKNSTTDLDY